MKIQTKASTILERTSHLLRAGVITEKPAWFDIVANHPPQFDLTKKPIVFNNKSQQSDPCETLKQRGATGLFKTRSIVQDRNNKNNSIGRISKLKFLEDELRDVFYHQHPWEFSRPKTLIENSGDEMSKCDWSNMLQLNKPLDGESVVQRTLYLLKNNHCQNLFEAYDKARFEFYKLRMQEEMNSTISREESVMYGAVFPSTNLEWGVKQEQEAVDLWAKVAADKTKMLQASLGKGATGSSSVDQPETEENSIWDETFVVEGGDDAKP